MKKCYVCGREIKDKELYYHTFVDSYVCANSKCFDTYFWDNLTNCIAHDQWHEYVIVDKKVYQIGSEYDEPLGFGGKHWNIQFNDGVLVETHSLWYRGELPLKLQQDFKDNAKFIED